MLVINKPELSAEIDQLRQVLPNLEQVEVAELLVLDDTWLVFSDVESFLTHQWKNPTIVLADATQGALLANGFWLFGIPDPIFWGVIGAFISFLPVVGAPTLCI
ncbi:MAG: hypothetical protein EOP49_14610, partial [Sphingobacteriales bacterium]